MAVQIQNVTLDVLVQLMLTALWPKARGWEIIVDQPGDWLMLRDPSGAEPSLAFQVMPRPKAVKHRMPLDLVPTAGEPESETQRPEVLGAMRVRDVAEDPVQSRWTMADREGNEFCVSRPPWEPRPDEPEPPCPT